MEWIVRECVDAAGCPLEISAAFVGADVLVCLQGEISRILDVLFRQNPGSLSLEMAV